MELATANAAVGPALKHALVGSIVGVGVAMVSNYTVSMITPQITKSMSSTPLSRAVCTGFLQGTVAALGVLLGDRLVTGLVGNDDPLFRLFYYQVVFHNGPGYGFANATRALVNQAWQPMSKGTDKCGDCTKTGKSCSGCSH